MKRTSAELKRLAREDLVHRYGIPIAVMVVTELILSVLMLPFSWDISLQYSSARELTIYYVATFIISLIGVIFAVGRLVIALRMARRQEYHFGDLFYGFRHHADRYILAELLLMLIFLVPVVLMIVSILAAVLLDKIALKVLMGVLIIVFMVAVIILALQYALVFYLLADHADWKLIQAFRESRRYMKGNKGRLFCIYLSFIGWIALAVLSLGIGSLWITPYIVQTQTRFYMDVTGESVEQQV